MNDTNDTTRRPAKTLSLKKTETSRLRQSYTHARPKGGVVKKNRARAEPGKPEPKPAAPETRAPEPVVEQQQQRPAPATRGVVLRQLTDEEKGARGRALADARVHEEEARKRAEEEARTRAAEDAR